MNRIILVSFISLIIASIVYSWNVYIFQKNFNVSLIVEENEYFANNNDIDKCYRLDSCLGQE